MATVTVRDDGGLLLHLPHDGDPGREARVLDRACVLAEVRKAADGKPEVKRYRELLRQFLAADKAARAARKEYEALSARRAELVEAMPEDMITRVMEIDAQLADLDRRATGPVALIRPMLEEARVKAERVVKGIVVAAAERRKAEVYERREQLAREAEEAVGADRVRELIDLNVIMADRQEMNVAGVAATVLGGDE